MQRKILVRSAAVRRSNTDVDAIVFADAAPDLAPAHEAHRAKKKLGLRYTLSGIAGTAEHLEIARLKGQLGVAATRLDMVHGNVARPRRSATTPTLPSIATNHSLSERTPFNRGVEPDILKLLRLQFRQTLSKHAVRHVTDCRSARIGEPLREDQQSTTDDHARASDPEYRRV